MEESNKRIFVGFHVSPEMDSYVRMYAVLQNIPMSQIYRANIRDWIENNSFTEEKLIDGIVDRIKLDWDKRNLAGKKVPADQFYKEWIDKLNKHLPVPLVDRIIAACSSKYGYIIVEENEENKETTTE